MLDYTGIDDKIGIKDIDIVLIKHVWWHYNLISADEMMWLLSDYSFYSHALKTKRDLVW